MQIIRAQHYGFCFGVKRAHEMVEEQLLKKGKIKVWGELIHNEPALEKLRKKGMITIEDLNDVSGDIIIRSHGISDKRMKEITKKADKVYNATCPYVISVHVFSKKFEDEGRQVIIIGDGNHPEMIGVMEDLKKPICVIDKKEAANLPKYEKIGVVVQTTLKKETFEEILEVIKTKSNDIKVKNTICNATQERQGAIIELAKQCDIVIVVGGKKSSNSKKLEELASKYCKTYKVETSDEIDLNWFKGKNIVGISAGASTPDWLINEVEKKILGI